MSPPHSLLHAHRPVARRLLADAEERSTEPGTLRAVSDEGLIGFSCQALANKPTRSRDIEDFRSLLRANGATLDLDEVREYFHFFERTESVGRAQCR